MDITLSHLKDKVAVVTGASAGIGEAAVIALVSRGLQVVGLARRREKLENLSQRLQNETGKFFPVQADISKESDIVNAFTWIKSNVGPVSVLINNAGIIRQKGLVDGESDSWREIFNTNVLGLCIATKLVVSDMIKNDVAGHIIHINSIAGHRVPNYPSVNVYPASKHAVTALTETLRTELNFIGSKIKVTSISPGAVNTELAMVAGITIDGKNVFETIPALYSEDVADSIVYVLATPPHVQVHELMLKPIGETL